MDDPSPLSPILSDADIAAWSPRPSPPPGDVDTGLADALTRWGLMPPAQMAGRHFPVACVSLEITQRCNLDCTLCYLSDLAEAVHDVPLEELFRRIDRILAHYGAGTNVQISGGDPTLRARDELIAIVARVAERGMVPALFTNGIKADRALLADLARAGLRDVAFHVDLTQERKGFASETALNVVRDRYIERARDLGLRILFNTTVCADNLAELPDLMAYFTARAHLVRMASFQMQADTGRGRLRSRGTAVTVTGVRQALEDGAGVRLFHDTPLIGHPDCNSYAGVLVCGTARYPLFRHGAYLTRLLGHAARFGQIWRRRQAGLGVCVTAITAPHLVAQGLVHVAQACWGLRHGLLRGKPVHKLSVFIHNFMDAGQLDQARCETCVFMVATGDGPLSMCVHNAKRDRYLTHPVKVRAGWWNPMTGRTAPVAEASPTPTPDALPAKKRKGRWRHATRTGSDPV